MKSNGKSRILAAFIVSLLVLAAFSSCGAERETAAAKSVVRFEAQINEKLPKYSFRLSQEGMEEGGICRYELSVYDPSADTGIPDGRLVQTFSMRTAVSEMPFRLVDLDFDGSLDMVVYVSHGAGSAGNCEVYLWRDKCGFMPVPAMRYSGVGLETFDEERQIVVLDRIHDSQTMQTLWQVEELSYEISSGQLPRFRELRRKVSTWNHETDKTECEVYQLIGGEWTVIFESEDIDAGSEAEKADSFFHYGMPDAISFADAVDKAVEKYGEGEYSRVGLRTIGRTTYYVISRRNDGENIGVSTGGEEVITINSRRAW